jgi:hypothetical protein
MVKRAVAKFNKKVSALLPVSSKTLEKRDLLGTSSAFSSLKNRTVNYLETKGQCLDDVTTSSSRMGLFAQRSIKKGNVIVPAPLYIRRRDSTCSADDNVCNATTTVKDDSVEHCFGHRESSLLLCPLSSAAFAQVTSSAADSLAKANAVLKWSSTMSMKSLYKLAVDDIFKVKKGI